MNYMYYIYPGYSIIAYRGLYSYPGVHTLPESIPYIHPYRGLYTFMLAILVLYILFPLALSDHRIHVLGTLGAIVSYICIGDRAVGRQSISYTILVRPL